MIDTLELNLTGKVKEKLPEGWKRSRNWREGLVNDIGDFIPLPTGLLFHQTGVRVFVSGGELRFLAVEMPCLLFNHNGQLLRSQKHFEEASTTVVKLIREVGSTQESHQLPVRRLDLVGHAKINPRELVNLYRDYCLPGIHSLPVHYPHESLRWEGSVMTCRIYDKQKKHTGAAGMTTRIEWQLQRLGLPKLFRRPLNLGNLDIRECYTVFRDLTRGFDPRPTVSGLSPAMLMSMAKAEGWSFRGTPFAELIRQSRTERVFRRLQREASRILVHVNETNLMDFFPENFEKYAPADLEGSIRKSKLY